VSHVSDTHRRLRRATLRSLVVSSLLCVGSPVHSEPPCEAECAELRAQVDQLEREAATLRMRPTGDTAFAMRHAWKSPAAWRRLERGMSRFEVMMTIGEPGKVVHYEGFERWEYPDFRGGRVSFDARGRLGGWYPPPGARSR